MDTRKKYAQHHIIYIVQLLYKKKESHLKYTQYDLYYKFDAIKESSGGRQRKWELLYSREGPR